MTMYRETRIALTCSYDSEADAAYIYLDHPIPPGTAEKVIPFDTTHGMFNLDLDSDGHILGLEILGAGHHLPPALLAKILRHSEPDVELP